MNQRPRNDDQGRDWMTASKAAKLLGIKRETLYAYASRGLVRTAPMGGKSRERVYHQGDLERLQARSRARAGHAAVAAGALRWGEPVLETRVGTIRPDGPWYRGRSAVALAREGAAFEDVCALLWESASRPEVAFGARALGAPAAPLRALLRPAAEPFDAILLTAGALAAAEPHAEPSIEIARQGAPTLLRRLVAACALARGGRAVERSIEAASTSRALLVALGGKASRAAVEALDAALVVAADHELNASTFTARVAASAGASLPAVVLAALATLSGPLHGAATARVEALVAEVGSPERAAAVVAARLGRGESVPGFGHPLYPDGDPRGALLLEVARDVGGRAPGARILTSLASTMHLVAAERPTLDVGLVALTSALRLGRGAPLAIFACARIAGWIAHALEQRAQGFLLRPRARYTGDAASPGA